MVVGENLQIRAKQWFILQSSGQVHTFQVAGKNDYDIKCCLYYSFYPLRSQLKIQLKTRIRHYSLGKSTEWNCLARCQGVATTTPTSYTIRDRARAIFFATGVLHHVPSVHSVFISMRKSKFATNPARCAVPIRSVRAKLDSYRGAIHARNIICVCRESLWTIWSVRMVHISTRHAANVTFPKLYNVAAMFAHSERMHSIFPCKPIQRTAASAKLFFFLCETPPEMTKSLISL